MMRVLFRRILWATAVLAITAGGSILLPKQVLAAWTIGAPIVTYWDGPNLTGAVAQEAVEAGFNLVWCHSIDQLAVAQQHGLRAMVTTANTPNDLLVPASLDGGVRQAALDAFIDQVKASPAAYMYYLADEPMVAGVSGNRPRWRLTSAGAIRTTRHISTSLLVTG